MKITVQRFDPTVDAAPYLSTYEVPHWEHMTALEALCYIYEKYEPISFDYSCHGRSCGRCGMMVDGKPTLTCIGPIDDSDHTIAPLPGFPVIRDLIVDNTKAQELTSLAYNRVATHKFTQEEIDFFPDLSVTRILKDIHYCTRCGLCDASCPAMKTNPNYVGPMTMLATAFRFYDPYDAADRVVEAYQNGFASCIHCGMCTQVCPSAEVDHLTYWQAIKDAAAERGLSV